MVDPKQKELDALKTSKIKITAQWTNDDYWERRYPDSDEMDCVNVAGWLIRINGLKFPRGNTDGDGNPDWTYRYTAPNTPEGRDIAIDRAMQDAKLPWSQLKR